MKLSALFYSVGIFSIIVFSTPQVQAQNHRGHSTHSIPAQISVWGGYSFQSIRFLGKTPDSQTQIFGLGYQKPLKEYSHNRLLWYTADLIPYVHYQYPKRDENNRFVSRTGFGLSPIGFALTQRNPGRISPFIRTTGGVMYMESNFPTDRSRRFNFTFDITLGGNIHFPPVGFLTLGYKFHHISNAETGSENPGLDSNFLFLKLSFH